MRAVGIHIVGPDDTDILAADHGTRGVLALKTPAAIAEHDRVLLALSFRVRGILVDPLFALGEAIRRERGIGLDLVVERDRGLDIFVLD
jgi:hypothetical protein